MYDIVNAMVLAARVSRLRSAAFDALVSLGVLVLGASNTHAHSLPISATMAAALLARRRWPLATMCVVSAAALAQVAVPAQVMRDPLWYDIAVPIAMYSVVKYGERILDGYIAAGIVLIGVIIEEIRHLSVSWWAFGPFLGAVCAGVWMTAYLMRTRRMYVAGLEDRAATLEREREALTRIAIADERAAIAREMHDVVAHSLAVIIVQADGGRYAMANDPETGRRTLETVAATGREALDEMRRLITLLRGGDEEEVGERADRRVIGRERLLGLVTRARSAGLTVVFDGTGIDSAASTSADLAAYRIIQESLTNILRHAGPLANVQVTARRTEQEFEVRITNDGGERQSHPIAAEPGHGLVGMRERVGVHGGTFEAGPYASGWRVCARIPITAAPAGGFRPDSDLTPANSR
jgi:signal transduction histidine kinase